MAFKGLHGGFPEVDTRGQGNFPLPWHVLPLNDWFGFFFIFFKVPKWSSHSGCGWSVPVGPSLHGVPRPDWKYHRAMGVLPSGCLVWLLHGRWQQSWIHMYQESTRDLSSCTQQLLRVCFHQIPFPSWSSSDLLRPNFVFISCQIFPSIRPSLNSNGKITGITWSTSSSRTFVSYCIKNPVTMGWLPKSHHNSFSLIVSLPVK